MPFVDAVRYILQTCFNEVNIGNAYNLEVIQMKNEEEEKTIKMQVSKLIWFSQRTIESLKIIRTHVEKYLCRKIHNSLSFQVCNRKDERFCRYIEGGYWLFSIRN